MNITPISGTSNVTPVQTNSNFDLFINNSGTNAANNSQWLTQEAFMQDVISAFQNFGFNILDNLGLNSTNNSNPLSTNINLSSALNNFVFSLQASLNQASAANQEDTNSEGTSRQEPTQGFNDFATDLLLLTLLNNNNSLLTGDSSISSNPLLQSNFDILLNLLGPLSPTITTPPTLNDFFNMLLNNLEIQINNQNGVGTSISTTV